jgi:hypothetical protein
MQNQEVLNITPSRRRSPEGRALSQLPNQHLVQRALRGISSSSDSSTEYPFGSPPPLRIHGIRPITPSHQSLSLALSLFLFISLSLLLSLYMVLYGY